MAFYTYSVVPFVAIFGLTPFAVRLPSALFGVLYTFVIYLLAKKLFDPRTALTASFFAAINPWSIIISRTGLEVNLSMVLITAAVTSFLYINKNKWFFVLSMFLFGLSVFSYHPAKIVAPLLIALLCTLFFSEVKKLKKALVLGGILFAFLYVVMLWFAIFSSGAAELRNVSIMSSPNLTLLVNQERTRTNAPLSVSKIFSNKPLFLMKDWSTRLVAPVSFNYLFLNGEAALDKGLGIYGEYHLFELPFIVFGILLAFQKKRKITVLLFFWFVIGLIPGSITINGNYTYRDVMVLPVLTLFGGYGFVKLLMFVKNRYIIIGYIGLSLLFFIYFCYLLFFAYPSYSREWWGYSQKEVITYMKNKTLSGRRVVLQGGRDWPILYAFYTGMKPDYFQREFERIKGKDTWQLQFGTIYIGNGIQDQKRLPTLGNGLLIVPESYFKNIVPLKSFYALDGGINYKVYETK